MQDGSMTDAKMDTPFDGVLKSPQIHSATHMRISISRCVTVARVQIAAQPMSNGNEIYW